MSSIDEVLEIAPLVLDAIGKIWAAYHAAAAGTITAAEVLAKMQAVHAGLDGDRAIEDAALAAKAHGSP